MGRLLRLYAHAVSEPQPAESSVNAQSSGAGPQSADSGGRQLNRPESRFRGAAVTTFAFLVGAAGAIGALTTLPRWTVGPLAGAAVGVGILTLARRWPPGRRGIAGIALCAAAGYAVLLVLGDTDRSSSARQSSSKSHSGTAGGIPSIADQWLDVRRGLAKEGWAIRSSRQELLRDDGRRSTILTLRPKDRECARQYSDQIRIFDVTRGRLEQTFKFEPTRRVDCETALNFKVLAVGRFEDDEDTRDLIGSYATADDGPQGIHLPVLITWDAVGQRYNLRGLLRDNAGFVLFKVGGRPPRGTDEAWLLDAADLFLKPYSLTSNVKAWGASNLIFRARGDTWAPLLAGVYRLTAGNPAPVGSDDLDERTPVVYKRVLWSLYTNREGLLYGGNCAISERRILTTDEKGPEALARDLARHAGEWVDSCEVDPNGS